MSLLLFSWSFCRYLLLLFYKDEAWDPFVQSFHSGSLPPCHHRHCHEQKQQPNSPGENETTTQQLQLQNILH